MEFVVAFFLGVIIAFLGILVGLSINERRKEE